MSTSMKKLIDDTDFDNLELLSKRWKKNTDQQSVLGASQTLIHGTQSKISQDPQLESHSHFLPINKTTLTAIQKQQNHSVTNKKRNPIPQVIDEDTQHFKNRLEHLLNTFKTDAVSQFMGMKRSMLQYQNQCVKSDTQKYLTMYEQKHQQLLKTKQKLIDVTRQAQKKTIQCEQMANFIHKLNQRVKIIKCVSRPFSILYENKQRQKAMKFKLNQAVKQNSRKLKYNALKGWMNIVKRSKQQKNQQNSERRIEMQVQEIVGKFQKQMDMLKEKLNQANNKNQQYELNKHNIQENLKKAFLRGVCAMNMQAMSVFGENGNQSQKNNNQNLQTMMETRSKQLSNSKFSQHQLDQNSILKGHLMQKSQNFVYNGYKPESKDHKWKQAPIVGIQEKRDYERPEQVIEPRQIKTQIIKPNTEGKVIKIIDGKSSTNDTKKNNMDKSIVSSRKKVQNK